MEQGLDLVGTRVCFVFGSGKGVEIWAVFIVGLFF